MAEMSNVSAGSGRGWRESICSHGMVEASPAGGFTQIPCYPYSCNSPSDFIQNQTVVWHHPCLLHNQDTFSCKLLISPSKQVLAFRTLKENKLPVSREGEL